MGCLNFQHVKYLDIFVNGGSL